MEGNVQTRVYYAISGKAYAFYSSHITRTTHTPYVIPFPSIHPSIRMT